MFPTVHKLSDSEASHPNALRGVRRTRTPKQTAKHQKVFHIVDQQSHASITTIIKSFSNLP